MADESTNELGYRARWVVPVTSPPIENGHIITLGEFITSVGAGRPDVSGEVVDFGDAVILPGLVNAHAHLALSMLHGRVPFTGSFVEWVRGVRAALPDDAAEAESAVRTAMHEGLRQSLAAGVTLVGDIGTGRAAIDAWRRAPIRVVGFLEVLGIGPKRWGRHPQSVQNALREIDRARAAAGQSLLQWLGLSPHAPYSTDPIVYKDAIQSGHVLCTHLAETREEMQFLRDGTGPFRDLLEAWGLWDGSFRPPGCSPVAYLKGLHLFDVHRVLAPLLVHVNYASDADLDTIADSGASVVYCPRSHRFFHHEPHRYRDMLARGINVCLGTDSLASSDSLSILDELRWLRRHDGEIDNETLLAMGTIRGAEALHTGHWAGALKPGREADFIVIPLSHPSARDPVEDLLRGGAAPVRVYVGGSQAYPMAGGADWTSAMG